MSALTAGVVRTLKVNSARMWSELERGFAQATDLAEHVMAAAGVDYRTACHVVGRAVRAAGRSRGHGAVAAAGGEGPPRLRSGRGSSAFPLRLVAVL